MRFVGLDLAWGSNGGTGLCFVEDNKVVESGFARTDEEIIERLRPITSEPCLVAIDAPLVISNKTGRRDCERAISRCFGKHHAGAHSSNLGMSAFANGSCGARLCLQLSLEMDPEITPLVPTRRAIEVYPHPVLSSRCSRYPDLSNRDNGPAPETFGPPGSRFPRTIA